MKKEALQPAGVERIYGDVPPFMAAEHVRDAAKLVVDAAVIGMPYDGIATFRGGATRRGPQEIRKFSLLFGGYNFDWDMDVFDTLRLADLGDVDVVPGDNAESYKRFEDKLGAVLGQGAVPFSLGGDHGITYPAMSAVARHHDAPMGLVVFDTHLDLSEALNGDRLTRASPILRICELQHVDPKRVAIIGARGPRNLPDWSPLYRELGISVFPMEQIEQEGIEAVSSTARDVATKDGAHLYVSVDIDSIDPAYAPGTNSPEPGGLTSREIIRGVRVAARDGFAGFDIVEVSPDFDSRSGSTSVLAARIVAEALCCLAASRSGRKDAWRHAHISRGG
ncbi:agmatinase [Roseovarius sp. TE539]|uniref:agmatinase family protein n=1 Tax=Roseovarius sp. TE539 TaxID=2249812 RepID=UPI000DE09192|nr:agmatinase family protein [Roseovarius sp. TE539]RBI69850.1 agmatinase [Roseovarius sp. TE539]